MPEKTRTPEITRMDAAAPEAIAVRRKFHDCRKRIPRPRKKIFRDMESPVKKPASPDLFRTFMRTRFLLSSAPVCTLSDAGRDIR